MCPPEGLESTPERIYIKKEINPFFNISDISSANPHLPSPQQCRLTAQTPTTNMSFPTCPPVGSENSYFYPSTPTWDAGTIYYCQKLVKVTGSISF